MQARLSRSDARLLWGAGIFGLLIVVLTTVLAPPNLKPESPVPSSYSADSQGALGAYILLDRLGFETQRWIDPPLRLLTEDNAVLVIAEPTQVPTAEERAALLQFVSKGGRVLFSGDLIASFFPLPNTAMNVTATSAVEHALLPSGYSRGAPQIQMLAMAKWGKGNITGGDKQVTVSTFDLYGTPDAPVVTLNEIASGEVIWWAGATPLTNAGMLQEENLRLLLNALSNPDGSKRRVFWDEYFHGDGGDLWSYVAKTPTPWALWQFAIIGGVVVFSFSRRSGPIVEFAGRSRLSPLEFVDTMGDLYFRAGAAAFASEALYSRLRRLLLRRLGLDQKTTDAQLSKLAASRLGVPGEELHTALETAAQLSKVAKPSPKQCLEVARSLARQTQLLTAPRYTASPLKSVQKQEKTA